MNTTSAKHLALGYAKASVVALAATPSSATETPEPVLTMVNIALSIDATNDGVGTAVEHQHFTNANADGDSQVNARDLAIGSPTFATLLNVVWTQGS